MIGVITIAWGRPQLTRFVLEYYRQFGMHGVCAYSHVCPDVEGWDYIRVPNAPRSNKWNAAASLLPRDIEGAFVIGSDDLLSPAYMKHVVSREQDYVSAKGCVFYDLATGRAGEGTFDRVGAGRYLSSYALQTLDFEPWIPDCHRNSDFAMGQRVQQRFVPYMTDHPGILDIKTGNNIWSYDHVKKGAKGWVDWYSSTFHAWVKEHFPLSLSALEKLPIEQ